MRFEVVPILPIARELYAKPRDMKRFQDYLKTMLNARGDDVELPPMNLMNPMGREHVAAAVERLIAMDAEKLLAEALREAEKKLPEPDVPVKAGLTVLDDVAGGWTHTELVEADLYFGAERSAKKKRDAWIVVPTWIKRAPDARAIREEALAAAFRARHRMAHGAPSTLREAMAQEGAAWRFAGRAPTLDAATLARIEKTLEPHLDSRVFATMFAGMYGDRAADEVGHKPLGVPERAGFELALARAR